MVYLCKNFGLNEVAEYWYQVVKINNYQRSRFVDKVTQKLGFNLTNKKITLLGWSFKKDTNDSRESAAIYISHELLKMGANIKVYDPKSSKEIIMKDLLEISEDFKNLSNKIEYIDNPYEATKGSCCVGILTEWDEFKALKWDDILNKMTDDKLIIDGRYILKDSKIKNIQYL